MILLDEGRYFTRLIRRLHPTPLVWGKPNGRGDVSLQSLVGRFGSEADPRSFKVLSLADETLSTGD